MSGLADGKQVDPAASCPEVDPSLGAVFRRSGMAKCQAVKDMVLSRGRSHAMTAWRGVAKGQPQGKLTVKPVLSSQPGKSGKPRPWSGLKR